MGNENTNENVLLGEWNEAVHLTVTSAGQTYQLYENTWNKADKDQTFIKKIVITNFTGNHGDVRIWDQAISGTGSLPIFGSGGDSLHAFEILHETNVSGATKTTTYTETQIPQVLFTAGIALKVNTVSSAKIVAEIGHR